MTGPLPGVESVMGQSTHASRRLLPSAYVALCLLCAGAWWTAPSAAFADAATDACAWEWGGTPEVTPTPCATAVPVTTTEFSAAEVRDWVTGAAVGGGLALCGLYVLVVLGFRRHG